MLWLTVIEHDSGRHAAELQQARRLVALAPHDQVALLWLWHAARCNHLERLERQADAARAALLPTLPSAHHPDPQIGDNDQPRK